MKHVAFVLAVALLAGAPALAAEPAGLYQRLGAGPGVQAIATALIERVAADPALGRSFAGSNLARIETHLAEQLCQLAGGGCGYEGDPMRRVHAGQKISEREFYGMVEALEAILVARGVGLADRNELLRRLAPLKRDVVNVPAEAG